MKGERRGKKATEEQMDVEVEVEVEV